jgi:osmotically-inducible protein OsmY
MGRTADFKGIYNPSKCMLRENAMPTIQTILRKVQAALELEPYIDIHHHRLKVDIENGALVIEGEVGSVAAKKLALEHAAAVDGVRGVIDRLHVAPVERKGDGEILELLYHLLAEEPVLQRCILRVWHKGRWETRRKPDDESLGEIWIRVEDGIVTLNGSVISLSHKRLVGVLAWWTPGCRDVINGLEVVPPEEDRDDEITDAVRLVLEKDPVVQADQIAVSTHNNIVTLSGLVSTKEQKRRAESDTWCVFAVDKVVNNIAVQER